MATEIARIESVKPCDGEGILIQWKWTKPARDYDRDVKTMKLKKEKFEVKVWKMGRQASELPATISKANIKVTWLAKLASLKDLIY